MTKAKKWFMECTQDEGIELRNSDGAIKKPNAAQTLGKIH